MKESLTALIVGCGYVGSRLKERLLKHHWKVQGIRRYAQEKNAEMSHKKRGDICSLLIKTLRAF